MALKEHLFRSDAAEELWTNSDDAIKRMVYLSELYDDVPPELDVSVSVLELHVFECSPEKRKKVLDWLNRED